jgi:hypothetical protein
MVIELQSFKSAVNNAKIIYLKWPDLIENVTD